MGFRVDREAEVTGIDESEHAETGYELTGIRAGSSGISRAADALAGRVPAPVNASKEG